MEKTEIPEGHSEKVEALLAEMRAFLMAPNYSPAAWPDIPASEISEACDLMRKAFLLKWDEDCDGDMPVKFYLIDRKKYHLIFDLPVAHGPYEVSSESDADREDRLLRNVSTAALAVRASGEYLSRIHFEIDEIRRKKACQAAAFPVFKIRWEAPQEWFVEPNKYDKPASLHATQEDAESFVPPEGFSRVRIEKLWATPTTRVSQSNDFAEYRAAVAALFGSIQPEFGVLQKLNLVRR